MCTSPVYIGSGIINLYQWPYLVTQTESRLYMTDKEMCWILRFMVKEVDYLFFLVLHTNTRAETTTSRACAKRLNFQDLIRSQSSAKSPIGTLPLYIDFTYSLLTKYIVLCTLCSLKGYLMNFWTIERGCVLNSKSAYHNNYYSPRPHIVGSWRFSTY